MTTEGSTADPVEKMRKAFSEFEKIQNRFAKYGATDTEPDSIMQLVVAKHLGLRAGEKKFPTSAEGWELYSDMDGAGAAAHSLTEGAKSLVTKIQPLYEKSGLVRNEILGYLWRVL